MTIETVAAVAPSALEAAGAAVVDSSKSIVNAVVGAVEANPLLAVYGTGLVVGALFGAALSQTLIGKRGVSWIEGSIRGIARVRIRSPFTQAPSADVIVTQMTPDEIRAEGLQRRPRAASRPVIFNADGDPVSFDELAA